MVSRLGSSTQAWEAPGSYKQRYDPLVYISFNELNKTSPCSLRCTEESMLGHREARPWLVHPKTDAQAGDWKVPPAPTWAERSVSCRDLHAGVRQVVEAAGRASCPRSPQEWTTSEIETGRRKAHLQWQISHHVTAPCGAKSSVALSAAGCPGLRASLDLKHLSWVVGTCGSGQTGRSNLNKDGSTGHRSTGTLKSHLWGLSPEFFIMAQSGSCPSLRKNESNRNIVK